MTEPTFEELVDEWLTHTKAMVERQDEVLEGWDVRGISIHELDNRGEKGPYETLRVDEREIMNFAGSIGDNNPLFRNPAYGLKTRYRSMIAPQTITCRIRSVSLHGARREGGVYPIANYFSGALFDWYDVIRPETRAFNEEIC